MSAVTPIQWTDRTWNPVRGCSRVSAGCDNCYAMGQAHRFSGAGKPYDGLTTIRRGKVDWTGKARLIPGALTEPVRWRKPQRIFVNSMSDLFHESLSNEEIAAVFGVMAACPQHTFQVLTKRPEHARKWFEWVAAAEADPYTTCLREAAAWVERGLWDKALQDVGLERDLPEFEPWPLPNVWLGTSVENQATANERIPLLLSCPAAIRWISAEPLLDRVRLDRPLLVCGSCLSSDALPGHDWLPIDEPSKVTWKPQSLRGVNQRTLDWVVCGGESGSGARPLDLAWLRLIVAQCKGAGVPVFVKQLGALPVERLTPTGAFRDGPNGKRQMELKADRVALRDRKGGDMSEWPAELQVRQFPEVRS